MSLNYKRCIAYGDYSLSAETVALSFLSLPSLLPLFLLSYQSWLGFRGGMVFNGKQGQRETF